MKKNSIGLCQVLKRNIENNNKGVNMKTWKEKLKNLKESIEDEIKNLFYAGLDVEQVYIKLKNDKYSSMDSGFLRDKIEKVFGQVSKQENVIKEKLKMRKNYIKIV